ncbi:MAG: NAD/NADP octopine/nopaline dehydrogenase family protein, partial [Gammaproteobacteria bacterium]
PYLARKQDATTVRVSGYATRLPSGALPARNTDHALSLLQQVYPAIERVEDALSGALMNAGPIIHPPLILMNAGPLQHFDAWDIHNEGTQPAIRTVTDALDAERIRIREALGYAPPHFPLADHYNPGGDEWMYGNAAHEKLTDSGDWREHIDLTEHRYMIEDVELGLALQASCGEYAEVDCPISNGLLAMGSAINGRDFMSSGRTLGSLGLATLAPDALRALLHDGI